MPQLQQAKRQIKEQKVEFQSSVTIIGDYAPLKKQSAQNYIQTLQFDPNLKSFIPHNIANSLIKSCNMYCKVKINPIKIVAQGNTIGMIDQNQNAWVLSDIFHSLVNLSLLIKKRVSQMFLNQKQAILKTKKGLILVNWGAKKLLDNQSLLKLPIYDSKTNYQNFFQAFSILDGTPDDSFLITNIKKSQNSNKMYRIINDQMEIHGYPTLERFSDFQSKIVGISVGKSHALCWDEKGRMYSWGTRCLALGFDSLPSQDLITLPTPLNFNFSVKTAFASNQYSLALCNDGRLFEWGIKKEINQINQQLIFQPRIFKFRYFNCENKKFTSLKGKNQKFGIISSTGQLYVWGQKTRMFVDPNASIPKEWQNGRLYEPYLVHSPPEQKIIDFCIEENYLCLITVPKACKYQMREETQYWNNVIDSVRNKFSLRKYRKIQTEASLQNLKDSIRLSTNDNKNDEKQIMNKSLTFRHPSCNRRQSSKNGNLKFNKTARDDKISNAERTQKSKRKYIEMTKSQERIFSYIMKPLKNQKIFGLSEGEQIPKRQYKKSHGTIAIGLNMIKINSQRKSVDSNAHNYSNFFENLKSTLPILQLVRDINFQKVEPIKKKKRQQHNKLINTPSSESLMKRKNDKKSYSLKLKDVLQKKKHLQNQSYNQTLKKLEGNSLEHRIKRHLEHQMQKEKYNNQQMLKNTIFKYLIKSYIVKLFGAPLGVGRQIKIQNFARTLKYERIEKNIRKIFIKTKIRSAMKKLQSMNFCRFALLTLEWRRYVKRFRDRKFQQNRKTVVDQLITYFVKDKIKLGLSTSHLNIRKIQKFRAWLILVKNQRMKCLKYLWKIHLFSIMKINPDSQNAVICHLPKNAQVLTFEGLYKEKVQQNNNLKLQSFLSKSPLFKIKLSYFQKVANLFTEEHKPLHRSEKIINYLSNKKRTKIKFLDSDDEQKIQKEPTFKINILNGDICPYSLHYNIFSKPKNYDIAISQVMKKSDKWIRQEKQISEKLLLNIIYNHQKVYLKKSLQYDLELALFIRDKYQVFSEKRWKYIIEYNQIQKSLSKNKKEKELYRLMNLIGMRKLLEQDCIPQKHIILDEALKRKDAPKPPNHFIAFGQKEFKQAFKLYYENVHARAKQMRKISLN